MLNKENNTIKISPLGHTWILDLDGTIVKHNGYKIDSYDTFLDGAKEFLDNIPETDMVIFVTSRTDECIEQTKNFLEENEVRYHAIIHNAPYGERILINDAKPSGLEMAVAVNPKRDLFMTEIFEVDKEL